MSRWRGHFGTLSPFYAACEKAGGFVGRAQNVVGPPEDLRGGFAGEAAKALKRCGAGALEDLLLYKPAVRSDGSVCDWGNPIRCDSDEARLSMLAAFRLQNQRSWKELALQTTLLTHESQILKKITPRINARCHTRCPVLSNHRVHTHCEVSKAGMLCTAILRSHNTFVQPTLFA